MMATNTFGEYNRKKVMPIYIQNDHSKQKHSSDRFDVMHNNIYHGKRL